MIALPNVLFLIFLVLKLTGFIDWSWWVVTLPKVAGFWVGVISYATVETAKESLRCDRGSLLLLGNVAAWVPAIIYAIVVLWLKG